AHHRFGDERRDRLRPFLEDHLFELGGKPGREFLLTLAVACEAIVMRTARMQDVLDWKVEIEVIIWKAGQRCGRHGDAMVASQAADDLFLLRAPERVVHVPDKLDLAVVRL